MKKTIIIAVAVIVIAGAIYWMGFREPGSSIFPFGQKAGQQAVEEPASGLGGEIFGGVQQNPAENMQETNPFEKDINPFKDAYTNPFE